MTMEAEKVCDHLDKMGLNYRKVDHAAVYTIAEMEELGMDNPDGIVKNLFLCDASGKRHFLVLMRRDKKVDLKELRGKIGSSALRFASEERLQKHLGLTKGAVSPLGILNDDVQAVEILFDQDLKSLETLGVHPNDNTATVWLSPADLLRVIEERGNKITFLEL